MDRTGICLVGCGHYAAAHAGALSRMGVARLYFAGRDPVRSADFAARHGGEALPSFEAACDDPRVGGLILCVPHDLHRRFAERAVASGKAVLLEKPLAHTLEDGEALARLDARRLLVGENYAFMPFVPAAVRLLREAVVGRPRGVCAVHSKRYAPAGWRLRKERMGGGLLADVGPHYLRLLQILLGPLRRVRLLEARRPIAAMEGESEFRLALDFGEGVEGTFEASWDRDWDRSVPNVLVEGDGGALAYTCDRAYIELRGDTLRRVPIDASDPMGKETLLRHFLEVVGGAAPAVDAVKALQDLRAVDAAYRSAASGRWEAVGP
ncbi:MAG: Gfo/Idh/MocA family oxidoreductase [Elusimicrobiota bacterium]|jgi:predicted dehydrogenase